MSSQIKWTDSAATSEETPVLISAPVTEPILLEHAASLYGVEKMVMLQGEAMVETRDVPLDSPDTIDESLSFTLNQCYQETPIREYDLAATHLQTQLAPYPASVSYHQVATPQPMSIPASDIRQPRWNPDYHKVISPHVERANRAVEEFRIYFGAGDSANELEQLQKICYLCGIALADLPQTEEGCTAVREEPDCSDFD